MTTITRRAALAAIAGTARRHACGHRRRLHGSAIKSLAAAETRDRLTKADCEALRAHSPADVMAMWKADFVRYGRLVKEVGITG